jgi:protein transport protein SEC23
MNKIIACIEVLEPDSFPYDPNNDRQERATGCALQVALSLIETTPINTRVALLISGPCTIGPGQIVSIPLGETMRTFIDINDNNLNNKHFKSAKKFYDGIEARLSQKHTLDIWAFGLDQYGLIEMKDMAAKSGGIIAMHELFNHFIFDSSFSMHYSANEQGMFSFPIAAKLSMFISKEMKIKGLLGYGRSLKEDKLNMSSDM